MEENLKKLLTDLIKQETARKNAQDEIIAQIEQEKGMLSIKEQTEIERFTDGIKEDIDTGIYNNITEKEMQKLIDETKSNIMERYNAERKQLATRLEEVEKEQEKDRKDIYKQINSGIKEYHTDLVLESTKAQRELAKMETEREEALKEIQQKIRETEAKRTHMIIRNRNFMDIEGSQISADIRVLEIELEQLKEQKDKLSSEFDEKIEVQSQYVQQCADKKDRLARVIGGITLSDKSLEEINQMLFGDTELELEAEDVEVEEEQQLEQVVEEPVVKEIEEEQQPEQVVEEPVVKEIEEEQQLEPVIEEPEVEVIEEEQQPEQTVEEPKVEPIVIVQQVPEVIKKEQPVQKVAQEAIPKVEEKQPVRKQTIVPEEDRSYKYYKTNQANIIKAFMLATGIRKNEALEIFKSKDHCIAIGELCRVSMRPPKKNLDEIFKLMEDYYWGIDSKLDIEISNKGIQYNQELVIPEDISGLAVDENEFVAGIIEKFENQLLSYASNPKTFAFDRNVIIAIAMDNCIEDKDKNLQLTTSGRKKIGEYLDLVVNPLNKKGSVTYNLEKISLFRGIFNKSVWSPKKVMEFGKIAYLAKNTYAKVLPNSIVNAQWSVKDWFKGLTTKKLTQAETKVQKEVKENKEKRNKWELPFEQKLFANTRKGKYEIPSKQKTEKEEIEL